MMPLQPLLAASASHDLRALLEFSRLLNECDSPSVIYNNVLLSLMGKLALGRAAVAFAAEDGGFLVQQVKGLGDTLNGARLHAVGDLRPGLFPVAEMIPDEAQRALLADVRIEQVMPIVSGEQAFALLLLGTPMMRTISESEAWSYAMVIGAIAAMALDGCQVRGFLNDANRRLERRVHRLRSLLETVREFNVLLDQGAILRLLGFTLMGEMQIARFVIALRNGPHYCVVLNHRFATEFPHEVLNVVAGWGTTVMNERAGLDAQRTELYDQGVRAAIPMESQNSRGVLLVGERLRYPIDPEDLEFLSLIANLAIGALDNARMFQEMIIKERLEEDLRIAAEIQQGLLPRSLPSIPGFEIAARTIPTQQVGGDCFDTIELPDGRVLLTVSDVSGKGTPASLLMASVQAAVRSLAQLNLPLDDLVARVNDVIFHNTAADKFITAFFGIIDPSTGIFTYVNAGHNPPFLFSRGGTTQLDLGGVILGIMPSLIPYAMGAARMEPGDLLVLYTDGVTEAFNARLEEYGERRLRALFEEMPALTAAEALDSVREDLFRFVVDAPQSDDITIMTLRRNGPDRGRDEPGSP